MKWIAVLSLSVLAMGWVLCSHPAKSQEDQQATTDQEINKLLTERRDCFQQWVDVMEAEHRAGVSTISNLIRARNGLLGAELDLAQTPEERIRIYEKLVENLQDLEDAEKNQYDLGIGSLETALAAKAARLEMQVKLLRQQRAAE